MNSKINQREAVIDETIKVIRAYIQIRNENRITANDFAGLLCSFFEHERYVDHVRAYPIAAASALAALAKKEVGDLVRANMGKGDFNTFIKILQNLIVLCNWMNDNPTYNAEFDLNIYDNFDPNDNMEGLQSTLKKYQLLLKHEQEKKQLQAT
jgi:hypothetical protein